MRKVYKAVVFLIVLLLCLLITQTRLGYRDDLSTQNVFKDYYALPRGTVDVIATGTSAVQRGWISPIAYRRYGIASYSLATASQPFCLTKHIMKEAYRTQEPKAFVIDIRGAFKTSDDIRDGFIRRVTDNIADSAVRFNAIKETLTYAGLDNEHIDVDDMSYYIKLLKYHELYDPSKLPVEKGVQYYSGFAYYEPSYFNISPQRDVGVIREKEKLEANSITTLNDLLNYCDTIDAKVIFTVMPFAASKKQVKKINTAASIVRKRGYTCINFMDRKHREKLDVDFNKFLYNRNHTNYYGSEKITRYICKQLKRSINLPDRRKDIRCSVWKENYRAFRKASRQKKLEMYEKLQ